MLIFIIPLKSCQLAISWTLVCKLFERTLRSVCNQTYSQFKVLVVCHELPEIEFSHPHITYLQVTFPIPSKDFISKDKDKMRKMLLGLTKAKIFTPSHIMFVDADDYVSKYLAEFVNRNIDANGWFFNKGYEFRENNRSLKIRNNNFHMRTNTSHIIKYELFEPDLMMKISDITENCILNHINTAEILQSRGTTLEPLPFRGAVHVTSNGENIWWTQNKIADKSSKFNLKKTIYFYTKKMYQVAITRPLTNSICNEFGI